MGAMNRPLRQDEYQRNLGWRQLAVSKPKEGEQVLVWYRNNEQPTIMIWLDTADTYDIVLWAPIPKLSAKLRAMV